MSLLSSLVFTPLVAGAGVLLLPRGADRSIRAVALLGMLVHLALAVLLLVRFDADGGFQFVERAPWVERFGIEYHLGVDGISLWLVLLTALLGPIAVLCSWSGVRERVREFHLLLLLLQTGSAPEIVSLAISSMRAASRPAISSTFSPRANSSASGVNLPAVTTKPPFASRRPMAP